jgi:hypothetical protein
MTERRARRRRGVDTAAGEQPRAEPSRIPPQAGPSDEDVARALIRWQRTRQAVTVAPPADVDVAALVGAELDRREGERRQAESDRRYDRGRSPDQSPCAACGIESSLVVGEHGAAPGWRRPPDNIGWWCESCWRELHTAMATAADCRVSAIRRLLGCTLPLRALGNPNAFGAVKVYWREFPEAPPAVNPDQCWQHVNRDELRATWEAVAHPHVEPPERKPRTTACPRCGACRWRPDWRMITKEGPDWGPVTVGARWTESCAVCGGEPDDRPEPAREPLLDTNLGRLAPCEADRVAAQLLGVRESAYGEPVVPGLALRVGFKWAYEVVGDRHRQASTEPWDHADIDRMRRRLKREPVG